MLSTPSFIAPVLPHPSCRLPPACSRAPRRPLPRMSSANGNHTFRFDNVFKIHKTVMPADSDYSSALWHGAYLRYLEEARVLYFTHISLRYEDLVNVHNTGLVVRDLSIRYKVSARLGDEITISVNVAPSPSMIRIPIESEFVRVRDGVVLATALVTLAPIDAKTGKLRREWPEVLTSALGEVRKAVRERERGKGIEKG